MAFLCCESHLVIFIKDVCVAQQWLTSDSGIGKENFDFRGGKMSGQSAKKSINWHTGWLGEKDANGDLVGDWAHYVDKEQFRCRYCDVERKYTNGGRASLIAHSESGKHRKIADGKKGRVTGQPRLGVGFKITFLFWCFIDLRTWL